MVAADLYIVILGSAAGSRRWAFTGVAALCPLLADFVAEVGFEVVSTALAEFCGRDVRMVAAFGWRNISVDALEPTLAMQR